MTKIVDWLQQLPAICIQSMFVTASCIKSTIRPTARCWNGSRAVELVRPTAVHIYTLDRGPALESLKPVPRRRLREIAERVRASGIPAQVFA